MARILVIEDDPTQRLLTSSVLKSAGHEVLEGTDGVQGLDLARTERPEVIVCDVMMPGLNGYQMVAKLKEDTATATIPVIFLSAMKERSHIRIGMTTGADDYLPKPFSAAELKQSVASMLTKRQLQQARAAQVAEEKIAAALQDQRPSLSGRYEKQLLKELNQRWDREIDAEAGLHYPDVPILAVEMMGRLITHLPQGDKLAPSLKRLFESASDALYLFGARHLQPYGTHFIAIFANEVRPDPQKLRFQGVRAAFALQKALRATVESARGSPLPDAEARMLAPIALTSGSVTLLRVGDPLHGGDGATLATGAGLSAAVASAQCARAHGWPIACTTGFADGMAELISTGRTRVAVAAGDHHAALEIVELQAAATAG